MKKHLLFGLLVTTFLTNNAFATEVKVNAKYLNNLSSKVKWTEAKEGDEGAIKIGDKFYTYTYTKPSDYTKATEHISYNLSESDVDKVLFEGFTESYGGGAIRDNSDNSTKDIVADFLYNHASYGGAIRFEDYGKINSITGDFIGNYVEGGNVHAGAIMNFGNIEYIKGNFINNYASGDPFANGGVAGGAIFNNNYINKLEANFIGNHTNGGAGAIYNQTGAVINDITGNFIGNYADSKKNSVGGAIHNNGSINNIKGNFIKNYINSNQPAKGGAIYNQANITSITGNFSSNSVVGENAYGGAIRNQETINSIRGFFTANYTMGEKQSSGGAIDNLESIGSINAEFTDNYSKSKELSFGGAIINWNSIDTINGNFTENYAQSLNNYAYGGAIYNISTINNINGNFIGNYVVSKQYAVGGGIYNNGSINNITGDFKNNYVQSLEGSSFGGAILTFNSMNNITGSFTGNRSISESNSYLAYGGAIQAQADMTFSSGDKVRFMSGNYTKDNVRGKNYNAIFVGSYEGGPEPTTSIKTNEGGAWVINDNIEGGVDTETSVEYDYQYDLSFEGTDTIDKSGSTKQYINMNNAIINAKEISVSGTTLRLGKYNHEDKTANNWEGQGKIIATLTEKGLEELEGPAVTSLNLNNGVFDISNGYYETIKLKNHNSNGGFVHLDVDVENLKSDVLSFNGDVKGTTNLVLYASSDRNITGEYILFARSENDNEGSINSFKVARVYKSPYLYDVVMDRNDDNVNTTHIWELTMKNEVNPNKDVKPEADPNPNETPEDLVIPDKVVVTPEVIGSISLPNASVSQSSGMVYNVMRKVGINKVYCPGCGFYDYNWDGKSIRNVWADTTYNGVKIKSPVEVEAKVWGIEAGADLQQDLNNKLGAFLSYRKGNYEMNGKGEKYVSTIDSELDIDSYTAGLYYRYDNDNLYAFSTVYGGIQDAEISTGDGISNDTDGIEFGASAEIGYSQALSKTTYVTPSLSVFYSYIDYDDITDNLGKTTKYHSLNQVEVEAGVKLSKAVYTSEGFYSVYAKPSVVQTYVKGDEINITKLGKVDTLDNQTLGRIEIGGKYGFEDNWSVYGWANYTFGSDYKATSVGLGVNYAW